MTLPVSKGNTILLDILNKGIDMVSKDEWEKIEKEWLGQKR
jgi:ABC-type amino acid transport substrate-binding protein